MKTDTELKMEAINILIDHLGLVETEKFISLLQKESFDYTKWQRGLWNNKTVRELSHEAMEFVKSQSETNREDTKDAKGNI